MSSDFSIDVSSLQGRVPITLLTIKGDIDANTYERLQTKAEEVFSSGTRYLLLDLSSVPYISSAGIRALHSLFNLMRSGSTEDSEEAVYKGVRDGTYKSPHLKLLNPTEGVSRILSMSGYDMVLEIHKDLQEAVNSF
jgi:ABC-type transporter Mla MlaB component